MALDPMIQAFNEQAAAAPQEERTPEGMREAYRGMVALGGEPAAVAAVEDRTLPGPAGDIALRIYRPAGDGPHPGLVYFHGGGFTIGGLDTHDPVTRALCAGAGVTVVAIDYRLAPEAPFPAAVEDCWAATEWVVGQAADLGLDPDRMAVGGDSAGGNLATVVARRARDAGLSPALAFQLLVYPVTTHAEKLPSRTAPDCQTVFLNTETMAFFEENYLGSTGAERAHPDLSPLHTEDLSGLPPAWVATAAHDPLRDEGEAYARRLEDAGVSVEYVEYDTVPHAFFQMAGLLPVAQQALQDAAKALAKALA
jgi:acetyl esterase